MRNDAKNILALKDVADSHLGYPFRGAVKESSGGDVAVVQIKNADPEDGVDWPSVIRTTLTGRKRPDWLRAGDVLFTARGNRNSGVLVANPPEKAICAPQFFLLRAKNDSVIPEYLAWYINQAPAQRYFMQSAEGTFITSIRRAVLEALPVPVPSLERQRVIAKLADAVRQEKKLTEQLLQNREQQLRLVAHELMQ